MQQEDDSTDPSALLKTRAKVLTGIYFVGIAVVVAWFWTHDSGLKTIIDDKSLNSLGDFLAGVFAPVAFIWLAVTVFLQATELKLQREEMKENRLVMKEQADEARKQAEFLGAQTQAMRDQTFLISRQIEIADETARRTHRLSLFDKRVAIYTDMVAAGERLNKGGYDVGPSLENAANKSEFLFAQDFTQWLRTIIANLEARNQLFSDLQPMINRYALEGNNIILTADEKAKKQECERHEVWIKEQFRNYRMQEMFSKYLRLTGD